MSIDIMIWFIQRGNLNKSYQFQLNHADNKAKKERCQQAWTKPIDMVTSLCPLHTYLKQMSKLLFVLCHYNIVLGTCLFYHRADLFYVDFSFQMRCSSSCMIFEAVSTAMEWIAKSKLDIILLHIIDNFLIVSVLEQVGVQQWEAFLDMCEDIGLQQWLLYGMKLTQWAKKSGC